MHTPVLLLSGPVGVGKTSVGEEVSGVLDMQGIPHTFVDFDQLRYTYPRIPEDPWSSGLGLKNLKAIWKNGFTRGARNLVLSTVVEDHDFIDGLSRVIPDSEVSTFQLFATPETLQTRVEKREIGSGLEWHKNRALELLEILSGSEAPSDRRIDTEGKSITMLAEEIVGLIEWKR